MKSTFKKISLAVIITVFGAIVANAQNIDTKVIVLLNKASWCHVCKENGPRVKKDLMPMLMQDKNAQLVVNDLSNDKTIASSSKMLKKSGIKSFAKENKGTGMLYFIDVKSKELISSISIAKSNEEIMMAYKESLAKASTPKHAEKGHQCDKNCTTKM